MYHYDLIIPEKWHGDSGPISVDIFPMPVLDSRMYVIRIDDELLILDPVLVDETDKASLRDVCENASHATVLVTHSHYDHIAGVNRLRELIPVTLYTTPLCDRKMSDPHKNLSAYSLALVMGKSEEQQLFCEQFFDFAYSCRADEAYEKDLILDIHGQTPHRCISPRLLQSRNVSDTPAGTDAAGEPKPDAYSDEPFLYLRTVAAPGHSDCSQCIELRLFNGRLLAVFTGDSLVNGHDVITRFPTGSARVYRDETEPYLFALPDDTIIFPGHGDPAPMRELRHQLENRSVSTAPSDSGRL